MYSIRSANINDSEGINRVSHYLGYKDLSEVECESKLLKLLDSPTDEVYVAEYRGNIVGWLHLFFALRLASPNFYEIGGLVVDSEFRGKGVGRLLVEYAVNSHGGKIRVRCNDKRKESHEFYKAVGFSSTKVQRIFETGS